jgi:hypothetical protein
MFGALVFRAEAQRRRGRRKAEMAIDGCAALSVVVPESVGHLRARSGNAGRRSRFDVGASCFISAQRRRDAEEDAKLDCWSFPGVVLPYRLHPWSISGTQRLLAPWVWPRGALRFCPSARDFRCGHRPATSPWRVLPPAAAKKRSPAGLDFPHRQGVIRLVGGRLVHHNSGRTCRKRRFPHRL